jgi:hypothetical protein
MKKQDNMTPLRVNNSIINNCNDSEVDEISDKEFKRILRMINEITEDMNKYLNELKENSNKHLNEIREIM